MVYFDVSPSKMFRDNNKNLVSHINFEDPTHFFKTTQRLFSYAYKTIHLDVINLVSKKGAIFLAIQQDLLSSVSTNQKPWDKSRKTI